MLVSLVRSLLRVVLPRVDVLWLTLALGDRQGLALCEALGGRDAGVRHDFYGPAVHRRAVCFDRVEFERRRARFERLGLVDPVPSFVRNRRCAIDGSAGATATESPGVWSDA